MSKEALDNFIKDLDILSKQKKTSIFVPSQNKEFDFSLLNVQQHKEVLKTAFEGFEGAIKCNNIFNEIISANCVDHPEFLLSDRSYIMLQLRKASLSNIYSLNNEKYDLNTLPEPVFDFEGTKALSHSGISVTLAVPSLERDTIINKKLIAELTKLNSKQREKETLNYTLVYELVKFIKSVELGDNTFIFDDFNIYESKKLVEALPLKVNNEIMLWIGEFKDADEKNLKLEDETIVEIDASFMASD